MFFKLILERGHSSFLPRKPLYLLRFISGIWIFKESLFGNMFCWLSFYRPQRRLRLYLIYLPMLLQVSFQFDLIEHFSDFQHLLKQDQMMNCLESLKLVCIWYSWTSFHKKIWVRRKSKSWFKRSHRYKKSIRLLSKWFVSWNLGDNLGKGFHKLYSFYLP